MSMNSEDIYRAMLNVSNEGIVLVDMKGIFLDVNNAFCLMLGYKYEELIGMTTVDFIHPDYKSLFFGTFVPQIKETGSVKMNSLMVRKDGKNLPIELNGIRFVHQGHSALMAIVRDLRELKRVKESLYASEERYRFLSDNVADGVLLIRDGRVIFANKACNRMFCHGKAVDAGGMSLKNFFHKRIGNRIIKDIEANVNGRQSGKAIQGCFKGDDGREIWMKLRYKIVSWKGRRANIFTVRDITEAKQKEKAIENEKRFLAAENIKLKSIMKERYRFGDIIGWSSVMQEVYDLILRASATDAPVAIYGESGTGKELVARTIHLMSSRKDETFVPVNCGAIPEALFESAFFGHKKGAFTGAMTDKEGFFDLAHNGTLFLDEVGELHHDHQVKFLRAIEGGGYSAVGDNLLKKPNLRIISATNKDPHKMITERIMREDFFFRIHVIPIFLPPLRNRREDISLLVEHFCRIYKGESGSKIISGDVMNKLCAYEWPGNVRELENVVQRYFTLGRLDFAETCSASAKKEAKALFDFEDKNDGLFAMVEIFEKRYIVRMLEKFNWHKGKTATYLGIPPKTLYRKIKKYELTRI